MKLKVIIDYDYENDIDMVQFRYNGFIAYVYNGNDMACSNGVRGCYIRHNLETFKDMARRVTTAITNLGVTPGTEVEYFAITNRINPPVPLSRYIDLAMLWLQRRN